MSYLEKIRKYRNGFLESVKSGDAKNAGAYARAYLATLQETYEKTTGYLNRAKLLKEILKYEGYLSLIAEQGITEELKKEVVFGNEKSENKKENPTPDKSKTFSSSPVLAVKDESEWVADVFELRLPATLAVSTSTGNGTGFFITADGLVLTNHHVVHEENGTAQTNIRVKSGDGKISVSAKIVASDKKLDVALLKADVETSVPFIPLIEDYTKLRAGMDVLVIGNAFSLGLAPVAGTVKFPHAKDDDLIYTAPTNNGDSGGPVLNRKGECVGINKSITVSVSRGGKTLKAQGLTNATAADRIKTLVSGWKKEYGL